MGDKIFNNTVKFNDILSFDTGQKINVSNPAISVCWYVVIGHLSDIKSNVYLSRIN